MALLSEISLGATCKLTKGNLPAALAIKLCALFSIFPSSQTLQWSLLFAHGMVKFLRIASNPSQIQLSLSSFISYCSIGLYSHFNIEPSIFAGAWTHCGMSCCFGSAYAFFLDSSPSSFLATWTQSRHRLLQETSQNRPSAPCQVSWEAAF